MNKPPAPASHDQASELLAACCSVPDQQAGCVIQKDAFHYAVVGGLRLYGVLSAEGPAIGACSLDGEQPAGHVALVVSGLRRFLPRYFGMRPGPWGWYIVKYQSEARIYLDGFTNEHMRRLHCEFGLLPVDNPARLLGSTEAFYRS